MRLPAYTGCTSWSASSIRVLCNVCSDMVPLVRMFDLPGRWVSLCRSSAVSNVYTATPLTSYWLWQWILKFQTCSPCSFNLYPVHLTIHEWEHYHIIIENIDTWSAITIPPPGTSNCVRQWSDTKHVQVGRHRVKIKQYFMHSLCTSVRLHQLYQQVFIYLKYHNQVTVIQSQ